MVWNVALDKRLLFLFITLCFALVIFCKLTPPHVVPIIKTVIKHNNGTIENLDSPRDINFTETFLIDTLEFYENKKLIHKHLGRLGYQSDFFIDFDANFEVLKEGLYTFRIASDDGFRLSIDGKTVCEFVRDRPFDSTEGDVSLLKGIHHLQVSYFQRYGNLGLVGRYKEKDWNSSFLVGQSSSVIRWIKIE